MLHGRVASAQALTVLPVNILLEPEQMATALTVINHGDQAIAFQVRGFVWSQANGSDQLSPTEAMLSSPPLGTIPADGSQVIRMILRQPPRGEEATYRILLDQIPPPASPGMVRIALRLSIPIFAEPETRVAPHLQWHVENAGSRLTLVAVNDGTRHETIRNIALHAPDGAVLHVEANVSPYVLAGATRRWIIVTPASSAVTNTSMKLTALAESGPINQSVPVSATP